MSDDDDEMTAALLAAGALSADEHRAALARIGGDPAFAAAASEWEAALSPLAGLAPAAEPPPGLLERIEDRVEASRRRALTGRTLREPDGEWIEVAPGVRMKVLHRNLDLRRQTVLFDAAPGAVFPAHDHPQNEECYMISGDLIIGDEVLYAGDYHLAPAGGRHPLLTTRSGCRCILILAM